MSTNHRRNADTWDRYATRRSVFAQPATDEQFQNPLATVDQVGWLGTSIQGWRVLCLAAGGGRHGPLYAAAGAKVTVVDISAEMLRLDRQVATERRLELRTVETTMEDLSCLATGSLDLVIQPVSTCYVPKVAPVYAEVARVLRSGGLYISQHKSPASMQADTQYGPDGYGIAEPYYRNQPMPAVVSSQHREEGTVEFLHRWEELLGEMCRAGLVIEDLYEPSLGDQDSPPSSFKHRSCFIPPYVRVKARNKSEQPASNGGIIT